MTTRIKLRRDTAANWATSNPILASGEPGYITDTGTMKIGDGVTRWAALDYAVTGGLQVTDGTIHGDTSVSLSSGIGNRENWILTIDGNEGSFSEPDNAYSDGVAYDSLGNVYLVGWYGAGGCFLQKSSPSGEVLWNNFYNQYDSYGFGLTVDKNDNIIIILSEADGNSSSNDIVLVKLANDDGAIIWQKNISSYGDGDDYATCIDTDSNGDIFIAGSMPGDGSTDCYVGKFSGVNGNAIWQKIYDIDGLDDTGTGLTIDKDGNLGIVGSTSFEGEFTAIYKINGSTGAIMWQGKILATIWNNGNNSTYYVASSDITSDSNGDFYFSLVAFEGGPGSAALVVKFNGTTGATMWVRRIGESNSYTGSGSLICDDQNNVYLSSTQRKYKENYDIDSSFRATQQVTKLNSTGSVIWQRWLSEEQAETYDARQFNGGGPVGSGQSIRVQGDYVLVCGNSYYQSSYSDESQNWFTRPYAAQLNRDGTEFEVNGWSFKDSKLSVEFITVDRDIGGYNFDPATMSDVTDVTIVNGEVNMLANDDVSTISYINTSRVNKVTFEEKTLSLPAGGSVDVSREKLGYITAIGSFDAGEGGGSNTNGSVWLNGNDRDEKGATYSAGGWFTYSNWNDWDDYQQIPMVFKTDNEGKLVWQAGNALDQTNNADLVDVVYHQPTNTVIALGNDGELDGNEGFNVLYLDADSGGMRQDITHIRPSGEYDIYPTGLRVMSDGSPVVTGYINSAYVTYSDVTVGAAGLTGSSDSGTLVINKSKFVVDGVSTEYPTEDGNWYIYPASAAIYRVNGYGTDDGESLTFSYTGTLGSGARVDIDIVSGSPAITVHTAGSGYKVGQRLVIAGTNLGGTTSTNDLSLYIGAVDGSGGITAIDSTRWTTEAPVDATFTNVAVVSTGGDGLNGWVQYSPTENTYTFNKTGNGQYYGVGDTFKVLGTALGGATPANDLTITVASVSAAGYTSSGVNTFTVAGTPQSTHIKLYGGSDDYTQTGEYNIVHETNDDGFIWTPSWSVQIGSTDGNSYDDLFGIALDSSDNVIVSGYSDNLDLPNSADGPDQTGYVAKFSSEGELLWAVSVDGNEGNSEVWSVATDADDNVYAAMTDDDEDLVITKLNSDGEFVWQQGFYIDNSDTFSIAVTDSGDILVVGEIYQNEFFDNNYHQDNWNLLVLKLDKDGNTLFTRIIWSQNGVRFNNQDNYSNQLTIKDNRFSIAAHSYDPGDWDNQGIVIDLPLDGSGTGAYGNFYYEEVELQVRQRFMANDNNWSGTLVTPVTLVTRAPNFADEPYEDNDAWRNVTIYGNRDGQVQTIYKPEGGSITGVAKIVFEDGSEQTSSMQGLPQIEMSRVNGGGNEYYIRPEDNGKHIYQLNNTTVIIPNPNRTYLPIGFAITIINDSNNSGVWSEDYDENIYLSGGDGDSAYSWEIARYSMAVLVKIADGRWMISGSNVTDTWDY